MNFSNVEQAGPADPKAFPFLLLGNKIDVDNGNSRAVRIFKSFSETIDKVVVQELYESSLSAGLREKGKTMV